MIFVGIDVQTARGCACAILDEDGRSLGHFWCSGSATDVRSSVGRTLALAKQSLDTAVIGVDSPRMPIPAPRRHFWDGRKLQWRRRGHRDKGYGRHCEVVISAHGLANPQWTPPKDEAPPWMILGFELFDALAGALSVHEVFPSASYAQFEVDGPRLEIHLCGFGAGPKDMLDAYVCAASVREFAQQRGAEVGGGDGFGTIALPRPLSNPIPEVLRWPAD